MKKYTVFSHGYASPLLRCDHHLSTELDFDQVKNTSIQFEEDDILYVPSEDGLIWVSQRTLNTAIASAIELFKNKAAFRQICADFTPDFFFKEVAVQDVHLLKLDFSRLNRYIIKPKLGYYATAVRTITPDTDLSITERDSG